MPGQNQQVPADPWQEARSGYEERTAALRRRLEEYKDSLRTDPPPISEALVIKPGDTLLIRFLAKDITPTQVPDYEELLTGHLGVPVKLVVGEQMAVIRS